MASYVVVPTIQNILSGPNQQIDLNDINKNYYSPAFITSANWIQPIGDIVKNIWLPEDNQSSLLGIGITLNISLDNSRTENNIKKIEREHWDREAPILRGPVENIINGIVGDNQEKDQDYLIDGDLLTEDLYQLTYDCNYFFELSGGLISNYHFILKYKIFFTKNISSPTVWNAYTVLERVLNVVEPLREGELPRFTIDQSQRAWLESIETPEFQFTNSTLREVLQGVGSYIHAEPRLIKVKYEEIEDYYYVITFDKYGQGDYSEFPQIYKNYASKSHSINIENFATNLDSSVDNFVNNFENSVNGSIVEPFLNGYKSVLAEGTYVRITDQSMYIYTQYPIRSIKKLTCSINNQVLDITPFVFESAEYKALSSYDDKYPTSKSYAIYYTIGQNGVYGLNFKREQILQEWGNYSIVKILRAVSGDDTIAGESYELLYFNVEYVPIYPARVQQNKSLIEVGKEWTKPYNQGQNLIETNYYGENLKGVIARLGNVDKTVTYVIPNFPTVLPEIGKLYDDNYYISDTAIEVQPFYTKLTLALSKDFNRYSEYVGVNSVKRMYEISERQAFNSEISYREFCVFGYDIENSENVMLQDYETNIASAFNWGINPKRLAGVSAQGVGYNEENLGKVFLPVIISTFGNAMLISFKYEDNYSAGTYADNVTDLGSSINAIYTQTVPYTDLYGRIKYLKLDYLVNPTINKGENNENYLLPPNNNTNWISGGDKIISTGENPLFVEKGNTEILSFNYQLEFVSKDKDLIIGSALAKNLNFVKTQIKNPQLLLLKYRLNKFNPIIDATQGDVYFLASGTDLVYGNQFYQVISEENDYSAWAICLPIGNSKYEVMIGKNMPINKGTDLFKGLKFAIVSEKDLYK